MRGDLWTILVSALHLISEQRPIVFNPHCNTLMDWPEARKDCFYQDFSFFHSLVSIKQQVSLEFAFSRKFKWFHLTWSFQSALAWLFAVIATGGKWWVGSWEMAACVVLVILVSLQQGWRNEIASISQAVVVLVTWVYWELRVKVKQVKNSFIYLQNVGEQNLRGSMPYDFQQFIHLLLITNGWDLLMGKYNMVKT